MSKTEKVPFMPFYGADFYESESVALMDPAEEGVYMRLLWRQWREGSLPESEVDLEKLARGPVTPRVLACFPLRDDDRRRNAKLEEIRELHLKTSERLSEAGKRGRAKQLAAAVSGPGPGQAQAGLGESESESESETTPPPLRDNRDAALRGLADQVLAMLPEGKPDASPRKAFRSLMRASREPLGFAAEVKMVLTGGRDFRPQPTVDQVGRALWEMHVNGKPPEVRVLHSYVEGAMRGTGPPKRPASQGSNGSSATPGKVIRRIC